MNRQYPMRPLAKAIEAQGRFGDDILVHMNPVEVAGLASLSPTGRLSINPATGQPEAFLPLLAPALGMLGAKLGLGALGTAALTGVSTAAVTGDLRRGLVAGLTAGAASGIGDMFGGAAEAAGGAQTAADAASSSIDPSVFGGTDFLGQAAESGAMVDAIAPQNFIADAAQTGSLVDNALASANTDFASSLPGYAGELDTGFQNMLPDITGMQSFGLAALGAGNLAQMDQQDRLAEEAENRRMESEADLQSAYGDLQSAYAAAQPGARMGMSPYRSMMSRRTSQIPFTPPYGMAAGGRVETDPRDEWQRPPGNGDSPGGGSNPPIDDQSGPSGPAGPEEPAGGQTPGQGAGGPSVAFGGLIATPTDVEAKVLERAGSNTPLTPYQQSILEGFYNRNELMRRERVGAEDKAVSPGFLQFDENDPNAEYLAAINGTGIDPVTIQQGLRGKYSVAPPKDYMAGFEPEFSYFQNDPYNVFIPNRGFRPTEQGVESTGQYFDPILNREEYMQQLRDYYTLLAQYTPKMPEQPEQPTPIPDDSDTVGENTFGGDGDTGGTGGGGGAATGGSSGVGVNGGSSSGRNAIPGADWWDGPTYMNLGPGFSSFGAGNRMTFEDAFITEDDLGKINEFRAERIEDAKPLTMADYYNYQAARLLSQLQTLNYQGDNDYTRAVMEKVNQLRAEAAKYSQPSSQAPAAAPAGGGGGQQGDQLTLGGYATDMAPAEPRNRTEAFHQYSGGQKAWKDMSEMERIVHSLMFDTDYAKSDAVRSNPLFTRASNQRELIRQQTGFAEGGPVTLDTGMGNVDIEGGGIAELPSAMRRPRPEEIQMLADALMGRIEEADSVIEGFVQLYGPEMFAQLRDMILQEVVPNAQTEGLIQGEGSGMDDQVMGMIGDSQPVAVSPGEYIVPADVVSGLGDGSTDAGAKELDDMMARVRMARGGTTEQAPPINARGAMPV